MQAGLEMRPCWEDFSVGDFLDSLTAFEIGDHCQILEIRGVGSPEFSETG